MAKDLVLQRRGAADQILLLLALDRLERIEILGEAFDLDVSEAFAQRVAEAREKA